MSATVGRVALGRGSIPSAFKYEWKSSILCSRRWSISDSESESSRESKVASAELVEVGEGCGWEKGVAVG